MFAHTAIGLEGYFLYKNFTCLMANSVGNCTKKTVLADEDSTESVPPCAMTMDWVMAKPSPVPCCDFVAKRRPEKALKHPL